MPNRTGNRGPTVQTFGTLQGHQLQRYYDAAARLGVNHSEGYSWCVPLAEQSLIERVRHRIRSGRGIVKGIGDDCAALRVPRGHELLVTTDFTLENVHFRREWHSPQVVGRRCLTRGLSDIAAMGGEPRGVFLSLALPSDLQQKWVDRFFDGLLASADEFRVPLAGGDTAQSNGGIQADIVVIGLVPVGKAVLRSGARPGDTIYVTGTLGGSAGALKALAGRRAPVLSAAGGSTPISPKDYPRHFHPTARVDVGLWLRRRALASSMIDLSDGLSTDLAHICDESRVGAEIDAQSIPRARVGRPPREVSLDLALHGGEDYELLFTSAKKIPTTIARVGITKIGRITRRSGCVLIDGDHTRRKLTPQGWEHFRNTRIHS